MSTPYPRFLAVVGILIVAAAVGIAVHAQVGQGLIDPNVASEKELLSPPNMTPAVVKGLVDKRPFMSATELNAFLLGQKLTPGQAQRRLR